MDTATETSVRFQAVSPQFTVPDVVRTAEYYRDVLGFTVDGYFGDPPVFAIVSRGEVRFFFNRAEGSEVRTGRRRDGYDAYVSVGGVDALAEELRARAADIVEGPCDRVYQQRELIVRDLNGLVIAFGEEASQTTASASGAISRTDDARPA